MCDTWDLYMSQVILTVIKLWMKIYTNDCSLLNVKKLKFVDVSKALQVRNLKFSKDVLKHMLKQIQV